MKKKNIFIISNQFKMYLLNQQYGNIQELLDWFWIKHFCKVDKYDIFIHLTLYMKKYAYILCVIQEVSTGIEHKFHAGRFSLL